MAQTTPMMKQYLAIKQQYEDAFLFFRLGDFYELFFDDADLAAKELEITLTRRGKGEDAVPMCGVPHHSAEQYINTLVSKGYKVALCEQTEDPQSAKGVVRREVVQVITPGTVMGSGVQDARNQYVAAITETMSAYGVFAADLTTGETYACVVEDAERAMEELLSYRPKEVILEDNSTLTELIREKSDAFITYLHSPDDTAKEAAELPEELQSGASLLTAYLYQTAKRSLEHLQAFSQYEPSRFLQIDHYSRRNLEITETMRDRSKSGSLLGVLDFTRTAMGARRLKRWMEKPLYSQSEAEERHLMTGTLLDRFLERDHIRELLKHVYDLERLSGRVSFGTVNGRELLQLKKSLQQLHPLTEILKSLDCAPAKKLASGMTPPSELINLLELSISETPPVSITDGGVIKDGYNEQLDQYRDAMTNGRSWIAALEAKERQATGIRSLKIGFNKVFGYYIEVSKANISHVPEDRYERKQTLSNAERYVTPELKEKEKVILEAEDKSGKLEYELFTAIRDEVKTFIPQLQSAALSVSSLDVLQSFAEAAERHRYVKPVFNQEKTISLSRSRHPVVESVIDAGAYIENDFDLTADQDMLLITGPNMAGKSTYMRQLALIVIMAQAGSFVPAEQAELPLFDHIFTRIGAADDLASGQSTFMVEMNETRRAVDDATSRSLILLDEIGRGTSTYDGMALAQSVIEYIHNRIGAVTLFSTHYHELTVLAEKLNRLENVHASAREDNGVLTFLHRIQQGPADKSYGIHVARLAGLPDELIRRADDILHTFEKRNRQRTKETQQVEQLSLFPEAETDHPVIEELKQADLLHMTPVETVMYLDKLQRQLKEEGDDEANSKAGQSARR
ncbi:DNA mismatch repair protein MutS [Alkalicoccus luteus]|uniref:DNA mismatch repair protein MutS n=1 Tax=Alkalicoccus luteus TaxID=1237094 RepID=A0A969TTH7_9BACI|nr:DNA mismatch repair protein MutS [Alkalicoccus luteus]NJP36280.1 DNA mismatch repair protein MutS [Alkalicoccus luteus]